MARWLKAIARGMAWLTVAVALAPAWAADAPGPILLAAADTRKFSPSPDSLLAKSLLEVRANRLDTALADIEQLIRLQPDFKLAHLIKGDLLLAKSGNLSTLGAAPARSREQLSDLRDEARARLMRYVDQPPTGYLPLQIMLMSPSQKYALLADVERSRLYVFENANGEPRLVSDFYMTIGRNGPDKRLEGDKRTPTGVYFISQELPASQLTAFYGAGAFPINYPNELDQKQGRTGHGIWLHGVPSDTYSRPPRSSDGCVVVSNPDLKTISRHVVPGITPLIIANRTEWLERGQWQAQRKALLAKVDAWKSDWESRDADLYFGHYSRQFLTEAGSSWLQSKRRNVTQKAWIDVDMDDMSLYLYPKGDIAVLSFTQNYRSDTFSDTTRKRVYFQLENGQWRIALENTLPLGYSVAQKAR